MESWYRATDRIPLLYEAVFDADVTPEQALDLVLRDVAWSHQA